MFNFKCPICGPPIPLTLWCHALVPLAFSSHWLYLYSRMVSEYSIPQWRHIKFYHILIIFPRLLISCLSTFVNASSKCFLLSSWKYLQFLYQLYYNPLTSSVIISPRGCCCWSYKPNPLVFCVLLLFSFGFNLTVPWFHGFCAPWSYKTRCLLDVKLRFLLPSQVDTNNPTAESTPALANISPSINIAEIDFIF